MEKAVNTLVTLVGFGIVATMALAGGWFLRGLFYQSGRIQCPQPEDIE